MRRAMTYCLLAGLTLAGCATGGGDRETAPQAVRSATFDVRHAITVDVPAGTRDLRLWVAIPQQDPDQTIRNLTVDAPWEHDVKPDNEGNWFLYLQARDPRPGKTDVVTTFEVERREVRANVRPSATRPLTEDETVSMRSYLEADRNVVIDDEIRKLAKEIVGPERNPVVAAKKIYDWELANVDYWVKDPRNKKSSGVGSSAYCLTSKTGNCTDFHSLYAALSRAAGIPTRIVYGSFFKAELDGVQKDQSYHCWIEFFAPGPGWIPLDVAVADVFVGDFPTTPDNESLVSLTTADGYGGRDPAKVEYYFGNLEPRRVTWCRGRDIELEPRPAAGALNAVPKAHVEADGKVLKEKEHWTRLLTFREVR